MKQPEQKLAENLLLSRRVEDDRLMLADAVMLAALDGSRVLASSEVQALRESPLTMRRFRQLAMDRQRPQPAANDAWHGSHGMLRAASSGTVDAIGTDDGHWTLHFVGQGHAWRIILALDPAAPFAERLLREQPMLMVRDGSGAIVLQGALDADGECETAWPFDAEPGAHFQSHGAVFAVQPVH